MNERESWRRHRISSHLSSFPAKYFSIHSMYRINHQLNADDDGKSVYSCLLTSRRLSLSLFLSPRRSVPASRNVLAHLHCRLQGHEAFDKDASCISSKTSRKRKQNGLREFFFFAPLALRQLHPQFTSMIHLQCTSIASWMLYFSLPLFFYLKYKWLYEVTSTADRGAHFHSPILDLWLACDSVRFTFHVFSRARVTQDRCEERATFKKWNIG